MTNYQTRTVVPSTDGPTRPLLAGAAGGLILTVAAVTTLAVRVTSDVDENLWRWPWTADAFAVVQAVWVTAHALIIVGVLGLGRTRGLLLAVAGSALLVTGELASLVLADSTDAPIAVMAVYTLGALLAGIGLVTAGRRTRLAGACALVGVFLAPTPVGYVVIGIWGLLLIHMFLRKR